METLYRKIEIRTVDDLPTKAGMYFVGVKNNLHPEDIYEFFEYKNPVMQDHQYDYWLNTFDWYFAPVQMPDDEEIFHTATKMKLDKLRGNGNMSIGRMTLGEIEWMNICVDLGRWLRDKLTAK